MEAWAGFAGAVTGASAALIGMLVVALSINLRQIVGTRHLTSRAVLALLLLVVPLAASVLLLVPQGTTAYGTEMLILGVVVGTWMCVLARPTARSPEQPLPAWLVGTAAPVAAVTLAAVVAGVLLLAGDPAGLYGLPVLVLAGYGGALVGTWVLLVEILR